MIKLLNNKALTNFNYIFLTRNKTAVISHNILKRNFSESDSNHDESDDFSVTGEVLDLNNTSISGGIRDMNRNVKLVGNSIV
jgi:hypothetical protein